jgi:DnaJ domain
MGRRRQPTCQASATPYTPLVSKRDPHAVLGIERGASPTQVKAAWRRLARQHHPDLTGDDPEASRIATRQMAEINDAYAALTRPGGSGRRWAEDADTAAAREDRERGTAGARRGGPPRPKPTRPVTARVDTTGTVRPRNQPIRPMGAARGGSTLSGHPPLKITHEPREAPRASTPTGPMARSRIRNFRRPASPALDEARERELEFGKFHGHTLGQVAAFEPSYIDWLATTITRDPDLVAAARVVRDDLDVRGIVRHERPPSTPTRSGRTA